MDDSFGNLNTTATTAGATPEQKPEGVAPVLIKQILEAPEGNFQMWGMFFGIVECVAIVRSIDTSSTKITYLLEDYSGRIEGHYWLEEGDVLKAPNIMLNTYAKVYGSVRSQGGKQILMVFKMFPIVDANEVNTHILETLNARYKAEQFATKGNGITQDNIFGQNNVGGGANTGLEGKHLAVFQAIKSHGSAQGISRQELQAKFSHIKKDEMDSVLEIMVYDGHIYSTFDSDHFVSTE